MLLKLNPLQTTQYALYKLLYFLRAYIVVFLYTPSVCQKTNYVLYSCIFLSVWVSEASGLWQQCQRAAVFSLPLSVPWHIRSTTNSSVCRQCSCMSSLSWPNRYFYLCPVSMSPPAGPGYVGGAHAVRCHAPFSRAVAESEDVCLLCLSRPLLINKSWSFVKMYFKVDQSCCQCRKRNRKASEERERRHVFVLFKMLIHADYQKALVKRVSALPTCSSETIINICATHAHITALS